MTDFRRLVFCFLSTLVLGSVGIAQEAERTFKGRTFEEWKQLLPNDLDAETRADAYRAMYAFSHHFPDEYLKPASEFIKTSLPKEHAPQVLFVGFKLLPKMSASERNALRIAGLRSDLRSEVVRALAENYQIPTEEATEELADAVIEVLNKDRVVNVRYNAIKALKNIVRASEYDIENSKRIRPEGESGPIVKKAMPLMQEWIKDGDREGRLIALSALRNFPPEIAVQEIVRQLDDLLESGKISKNPRTPILTDDEKIVQDLIRHLGVYGPQAKNALPTLKQIQIDHPVLANKVDRVLKSSVNLIEKSAN